MCAGVISSDQRHLDTPLQGAVSFFLIPGKWWCPPSTKPQALVTRGSLFVPALEMEFCDFLPKDQWGVLGFSRLNPHPCQKLLFSSGISLKKKKKVRTQEAKQSFFFPSVTSSDVTSGPLPVPVLGWLTQQPLRGMTVGKHMPVERTGRKEEMGKWSPYCVPSSAGAPGTQCLIEC